MQMTKRQRKQTDISSNIKKRNENDKRKRNIDHQGTKHNKKKILNEHKPRKTNKPTKNKNKSKNKSETMIYMQK